MAGQKAQFETISKPLSTLTSPHSSGQGKGYKFVSDPNDIQIVAARPQGLKIITFPYIPFL